MSTLEELEKAIVAVEAQRGRLLENDVVELALLALQEKLVALQAPPAMQQHDAVCVLVADMSGFTTMSEFLDAEEVRDTINAVWQRLDRIILNWGGEIDKHLGDGVIALFGLSRLHEDDARRAVLAALDMQAELALFDEQQAAPAGNLLLRADRQTPPRTRVQMRVGLHIGPVYFGQVGIADEVTTVGDTIEIANKLQEMAPVGGVLISAELYERVTPFFEADEYEPTAVGSPLPPAFVVRREIPSPLSPTDVTVNSLETRFVGRADELDLLQHVLQQVIDNNQAQVITIVGEAGVGKSRLAYEFERLITLLPESICLMKGTPQPSLNEGPYSLLRSLFSSYFGIHAEHSPIIAREKLVRTILNRLHDDYDRAKLMAEQIPQLLGFANEPLGKVRATTGGLDGQVATLFVGEVSKRDREAGFESLVHLLTAVGEKNAAIVLILEDFHAADEGSYDFLDYLMQVCRQQPLLLVCLTRPSLFDKRPSWRMAEATERQEVPLPPLSPIDSRHLLTELLQKLEAMPLRLMDVISHSASGNPFHLHAVVQAFIAERVIETEDSYWQANMGRLLEVPSPPTLFNLWQGRLHQLPSLQQRLLQRAAIFGQTFWDVGLLALTAVEESTTLAEVNEQLQQLVGNGWFKPVLLTAVPNCRQYRFAGDYLQEVVYQTISESARPYLHTQAAAWLMEQPLLPTSRLLQQIAFHFEQAGKREQAAQWYGRAARHAQAELALETATAYYSRALSQLLPTPEMSSTQLALLNGLALVLRKQARVTDSVAIYRRIQQVAAADAATAVEAALGEFYCHFLQEDLRDALESIRPAETLAPTLADSTLSSMLLTARGWLALLAGQNKMASDRAREMYAHSRSLAPSAGWAFSRAFMGDLAREMNRYQQASEAVNMARDMFTSFNDLLWQGLLTIQLGRIAAEQWQIETAVGHYQQAIRFARNHGERFCLMLALRELGQIYRQQHRYAEAEAYYLHALAWAERSQNQAYLATLTIDLGQMYLSQALNTPQSVQEIAHQESFLHEAERWFSRGLRLGRKVDKPLVRALALMGLAKINVQEHLLEEAQTQAQEAVQLMERLLQQRPIKAIKRTTAVAWRVLGHTLAKVPQKKQQTAVGGKLVDAIACFVRSNELLKEVGISGNLERASTLRTWALLELRRDHLPQATHLAESARKLLLELGLPQDANQIKEMMRNG